MNLHERSRASFCNETVVELAAAAIERSGRIELTLRGSSMQPLYASGARVAFVRTDDIALGDVVLAQINGALRCHRLVKAERDGWLLRGDAHPSPDGIVRGDDILARAEGITVLHWSSSRVPRPVARWLRARLLLPALPIVRGIRHVSREIAALGAVHFIRAAPLGHLMTAHVRVSPLRAATGGVLASQLMAWGIRPTRDALAVWERRAAGRDAFALCAHAGARTTGLVGVDEAMQKNGARTGVVTDALVMGRLFAADTAKRLADALVRAARTRGLRDLRTLPSLPAPFRAALVSTGFEPLEAGTLAIGL